VRVCRIGEVLDELLQRDDISLTALSQKTMIKPGTLNSWRYHSNPKTKNGDLLRCARYFKVPLVYLLYKIWHEPFNTEKTGQFYLKGEEGEE
jgi:hypothetical protein